MRGLVLEGGGAKGAYHIGVYRALMELGFEFSGITGTSIGALNGAMIAQGDYDRAYKLWSELEPGELFQLDGDRVEEILNKEIDRENMRYILQKLKDIIKNRGLEVKGIKQTIEENIDEDKLRESSVEFGMVTFSLSDMKPLELFLEDIPRGSVTEYLLASSYLPAFRMEKVDDRYFLDGGFYDNLPINLLLKKNYEEIVAVRTFSRGRIRPVKEKEVDVDYIKPDEDLGGVLEFTPRRIEYNIELGYHDAHRYYGDFSGMKFYIGSKSGAEHDLEEIKPGVELALQMFIRIPDEDIERAAELLGIYDGPARRILFEKLLPRLVELLDLDEGAGYDEILMGCLELIALELEIERFTFYTFSEFWQKISEKFSPDSSIKESRLPKFLRRSEILSKNLRENLSFQLSARLFSSLLADKALPERLA